ncbi:MAG: DEAD/DEAH box helicase [Anaerolineae bacterium]|nr:DEAD/DEAH box helicase [Anaerolineae bacterium]
MTADFRTLNLHPDVMQAISDMNYQSPTPIQTQAIPELMAGYDVLGQAQTGTGKTAAFALPMLHALELGLPNPQALVVTPTRELAIQVTKAIREYGQHRHVRVLTVYGGQSYHIQISGLKRGVDIVVGTPGRILDLIDKKVLNLSQTQYVVLDEADEMLSMGFIEDIESILSETPESRQTALFSATLPPQIRRLASQYMHEPKTITTTPPKPTLSTIQQRYYMVKKEDKLAALTRLFEVEEINSALVFTRTRIGSAELADALLARGIPAEALHGDLSQAVRETVMGRFRSGKLTILVATDVAARGLDIDDISHVINYDIPENPEAYIHRTGRTARAGKSGIAITLVTPRERSRLRSIESHIRQQITSYTIPSTQEILAYRETAFLSRLKEGLQAIDAQTKHLVNDLLDAGYDAQDVAAAAIQLARLEEKERPIDDITPVTVNDRSSKQRSSKSRRSRESNRSKPRIRGAHEQGMVRFIISVGKAQGVRPRDIVGAIASEANIPGKAIGAIKIENEQSYVDVSVKHAERVSHKQQKFWIRGTSVHLDAVH